MVSNTVWMLCKRLLVCGKFKLCFLEISVCFSKISDLGLIVFTDAELQTWRAHCSMGKFEDTDLEQPVLSGWVETEVGVGAEGGKEGNQSPRGQLRGNVGYRLGSWATAHCIAGRTGMGKSVYSVVRSCTKREFWVTCLWELWRDHSSFVLFSFILFLANFFFFLFLNIIGG